MKVMPTLFRKSFIGSYKATSKVLQCPIALESKFRYLTVSLGSRLVSALATYFTYQNNHDLHEYREAPRRVFGAFDFRVSPRTAMVVFGRRIFLPKGCHIKHGSQLATQLVRRDVPALPFFLVLCVRLPWDRRILLIANSLESELVASQSQGQSRVV